MSKVAIKGADTGTGVFTLESPATNTDRTLVLPDEAGTVLTTATPLSSFPSGFANGITEADVWRLAASFTTTSGVETLTANFERVDDTPFAKIGTGMSESSGLFTFPSTGVYLVSASGYYSGGSLSYAGLQLRASADGGSTFDTFCYSFNSLYSSVSSSYAGTINVESFVNVTNTSNVKVIFQTYTSGPTNLIGDTNLSGTWFKFIRLGDAQ